MITYGFFSISVNGRAIYGRTQEDRRRHANFLASTNCATPLHDSTGTRRFICVKVPDGEVIDNESEVDYEQLYAQLVAEVEAGKRYWFTNEDIAEIQKANIPFQNTDDLSDAVFSCVEDGDTARTLEEICCHICESYPSLVPNQSMKIKVGGVLKANGYSQKIQHQKRLYYVSLV